MCDGLKKLNYTTGLSAKYSRIGRTHEIPLIQKSSQCQDFFSSVNELWIYGTAKPRSGSGIGQQFQETAGQVQRVGHVMSFRRYLKTQLYIRAYHSH